jgi:hypothetical protein
MNVKLKNMARRVRSALQPFSLGGIPTPTPFVSVWHPNRLGYHRNGAIRLHVHRPRLHMHRPRLHMHRPRLHENRCGLRIRLMVAAVAVAIPLMRGDYTSGQHDRQAQR